MAAPDAWAQLDAIAGPEQSAPHPTQQAPASPTAGQGEAWAQLDQIAGPEGAQDKPAALTGEQYAKELHDRINRGDDLASIQAFVRGQGINPDAVQGLKEAVAWHHDRHLGGDSPVLITNPAKPEVAKPEIDPGAGVLGSGLVGALESVPYADEIGGTVDAGFNSLGNLVGLGDGKSFTQHMDDSIDQNRAMANYAWDHHPIAYGAGIVGGGIGTALLGGEAIKAASLVPGAIGRGAAALGADTLGAGIARAGLGGALYGSDVADGSVGDRIKGAALGGTIGAGLGTVGGLAARKFASLAPTASAVAGRDVLDAAGRLSRDGVTVQPLPADVGGGITRAGAAIGNQGLVSGSMLEKAGSGYQNAIAGAADRAADSLRPGSAAATGLEDAGNAILSPQGLGGFEANSKAATDAAYAQASQLAGGARIITPKTVNALDQQIARLDAVPGGVAGTDHLRNLRDDLVNGYHTIDSLRDLRTTFGDKLDASNGTVRSTAKQLWGNLSQDIQDGLAAQGKQDAADAYTAADGMFARDRAIRDNVVRPLVGRPDDPRGGDQVARKLLSQLRTDHTGLDASLSAMTPDLAGNTRGAIIKELGRTKPGQQNAEGDAFSPNTFLTNWNRLGDGAKETLVPSSTQARQDIEDVATLAGGVRGKNALNNHSNTARAFHGLRGLGEFASGAAGMATLGKSLAAEAVVGKLLSSPRVASGIVAMGEKRPLASVALKSLSQLPREQAMVPRLDGGNTNN